MKAKYKLPLGTKDYLPDECYRKNKIENDIMTCFYAHGYHRVETPHFEYYDLFSEGVGEISSKRLFKITDIEDGALLVLRPDMTTPISRIVSTKLKDDDVVKYCYLANSFSLTKKANRLREFTQCGIELMANSSPVVDADIIILAIESLLKVGLTDFQLDIGQVQYFRGLLDELRLVKDDEDTLIDLIDKKDMLGVELFADRVGIGEDKMNTLLKLPSLFGGVEILDEALTLINNNDSKHAIEHLKEVYAILDKCGMSEYITFDLSLVNGVSYYTGIVFKGITKYFGEAILSGGRYDTLCSSFNKNKPAIGFAIGVNHLMRALEKGNNQISIPDIDYVVGYDIDSYKTAYEIISSLIDRGYTVDNSYKHTYEETLSYKNAINAKHMIYIEKQNASRTVNIHVFDKDIIINAKGKAEEI